jgi:hypothetical protein
VARRVALLGHESVLVYEHSVEISLGHVRIAI